MCGTAIAELSRDFCNSIVTGPVVNITNNKGLSQYEHNQHYQTLREQRSPVVVSRSVSLAAKTCIKVLPTTVTACVACSHTTTQQNSITSKSSQLAVVGSRGNDPADGAACVRGGRRTVRRELERQRRSLHAAGVEDLRKMLLPAKSGPVSITQVLQEAVRVVLTAKAEERGALHAKEFLKEKRSYLRAKLANIKCGIQPIDDDKIIKDFVTKVRSEQEALEQESI